MADDRDIVYMVGALGFGVWGFFWGFMRLRRKRLIENIPTSTIRGLAMGLVELSGCAKKDKLLKSPLTKTDCVYYRYLIEEYRSSGKSGSWVTIAKGDSSSLSFWLDDGTGQILVNPFEAETILPVDYKYRTGLLKDPTPSLMDFLTSSGMKYRGRIFKRTLRFSEWYIKEDETVYVLGVAKKQKESSVDYKGKLNLRLQELKNSTQEMEKIDLNKDGQVGQEEWDKAVKKIEQELLQAELESTQNDIPTDVVIGKGDVETTFIISDHGQKELIKKLNGQVILGIFGGVVLVLFSFWYLWVRLADIF